MDTTATGQPLKAYRCLSLDPPIRPSTHPSVRIHRSNLFGARCCDFHWLLLIHDLLCCLVGWLVRFERLLRPPQQGRAQKKNLRNHHRDDDDDSDDDGGGGRSRYVCTSPRVGGRHRLTASHQLFTRCRVHVGVRTLLCLRGVFVVRLFVPSPRP